MIVCEVDILHPLCQCIRISVALCFYDLCALPVVDRKVDREQGIGDTYCKWGAMGRGGGCRCAVVYSIDSDSGACL
jgi:hypothetical protein